MFGNGGMVPLALSFAGGGKAASVGLDVFDSAALDGIGLAAVVFFRLELGPKRIVEAVDHIEHGASHRDLDYLGVSPETATP
jgi:hypothetical protein